MDITESRLVLAGAKANLTTQNLIDAVSQFTLTNNNFANPTQQQQIYGRFNKPDSILPVSSKSNVDMKLSALYDNNKDFQYQWHTDNTVVPTVFIGVSGCGKTYQMLKHATTSYLCYTTAADKQNEQDQYYAALTYQLVKLSYTIEKDVQRSISAYNLTLLWMISKLACLTVLLDNKNFTPREFALSQINGATRYYRDCFFACLAIEASVNTLKLEKIHKELMVIIRKKTTLPIGIAFDEAQMMIPKFDKNYFVKDNEGGFRGLLYAVLYLCGLMREDYNWIAYAGTELSLGESDTIQSGTGRDRDLQKFLLFPYFNSKKQIIDAFSNFIDMSDCDLTADEVRKLTGRPRTLCYAVQLLSDDGKSSKQKLLSNAIKNSYENMLAVIVNRVTTQLQNNKIKGKIITLLLKIVIAKTLNVDFVITAKTQTHFDMVNAGIFHIRNFQQGWEGAEDYIFPNEPLGMDVVFALLPEFEQDWAKDNRIAQHILRIHRTIGHGEKGYIMEQIVGEGQPHCTTHSENPQIHRTIGHGEKGYIIDQIFCEALLSKAIMKRLQTIAEPYEENDTHLITGFSFRSNLTFRDLGLDIKPKQGTTEANLESACDHQILQEFVDGVQSREGLLLFPNQNFGPDIIGMQTLIEEGEKKKRTMWVSCKVRKRMVKGEALKAKSQMNPQHAYFMHRDTIPKLNSQCKGPRKSYLKLQKKLDLDKVLMMDVALYHSDGHHLMTKEDLKSGQVLIRIRWSNLDMLFDESNFVSVIEAVRSSDSVEVPNNMLEMMDDDETMEHLEEEHLEEEQHAEDFEPPRKKQKRTVVVFQESTFLPQKEEVNVMSALFTAMNEKLLTLEQVGLLGTAFNNNELVTPITNLARQVKAWSKDKTNSDYCNLLDQILEAIGNK